MASVLRRSSDAAINVFMPPKDGEGKGRGNTFVRRMSQTVALTLYEAANDHFDPDTAWDTPELLKEEVKEEVKEDYRIKVSDNHIFLFITLAKRKYYSPHLHIELEEKEDKTTHVKGLFGPDQTVWTFFMFLHFIIAGIFLIFSCFFK